MRAGLVDISTVTSGQRIPNGHFDAIGLTDEWIRRRTGITARWWMDESDRLEDVAAAACAPLVSARGSTSEVGALLVVSTSSTDTVPGIAQRVAKIAGLPKTVLTFDMNAACSGFVYGLIAALSLCESNQCGAVIVCSVEAMSRMTDKGDRNSACLFGDGAAAVLVEPREDFRPSAWVAGCDGDRADLMRYADGGIRLDGLNVYERAVRMMSDTVSQLRRRSVEPAIIVGHQANGRILQKVRESIADDDITFVECMAEFGNTSSASIPLALGTSLAAGEIPSKGRAALVAYGAGESWGGVSLDYDLTAAGHRQAV